MANAATARLIEAAHAAVAGVTFEWSRINPDGKRDDPPPPSFIRGWASVTLPGESRCVIELTIDAYNRQCGTAVLDSICTHLRCVTDIARTVPISEQMLSAAWLLMETK